MVQQVTSRRPAAFGAAILVLVAAGVLLWHLLACTESPMAFSPDGKNLAFVIMDPYPGKDDPRLAGPYQYRLMAVSDRKDLKVVEETSDAVLTGPAYSPDGSQLCYLRIPLMKKKDLDELKESSDLSDKRWKEFIEATASRPTSEESQWNSENRTLPDLEKSIGMLHQILATRPVKAEFVIRKTADWSVLKTIPLNLPLNMANKASNDLPAIFMTYLTARPQFSPDGKSIYLCIGDFLMALDPQQLTRKLLVAPAKVSVLSPDGKTIAFLQDNAVGFIQTDGSKAIYARHKGELMINGLAWAGNDMIAILNESSAAADDGNTAAATTPATAQSNSRRLVITFMRTDGTVLPSPRIEIPQVNISKNDISLSELAVAGDKQHVVVSLMSRVFFMDGGGKILNQINLAKDEPATQPDSEKSILIQPTFSPDGQAVAFKKITAKNDITRPDSIVYYTPDGKELASVPIPPLKDGATRPAE